jgi:hypothetical protein
VAAAGWVMGGVSMADVWSGYRRVCLLRRRLRASLVRESHIDRQFVGVRCISRQSIPARPDPGPGPWYQHSHNTLFTKLHFPDCIPTRESALFACLVHRVSGKPKWECHFMQYTYGQLTIDSDKLNPIGLEALVKRGLSHLLGNEQSAKVGPESAWFKNFVKDQSRNPTADEVSAQKVDFQKSAIESLYDGTIGTRASGPRVDPITAEMQTIARREIADVLRTQGIKKFPAGDATVTLAGETYTGEQLVARRIAKHGDRLRKEAEKAVDARAKKAKAAAHAAAMAAEKGVVDAESLGL